MQKTSFYKEIAANKLRKFVLMFVFALLVLAIGYAFGEYMGNPYFGLGLAFAVSLAMAFGSYYWSDKIVLAMSRARPVEKHEYPHLYNVAGGDGDRVGAPDAEGVRHRRPLA